MLLPTLALAFVGFFFFFFSFPNAIWLVREMVNFHTRKKITQRARGERERVQKVEQRKEEEEDRGTIARWVFARARELFAEKRKSLFSDE